MKRRLGILLLCVLLALQVPVLTARAEDAARRALEDAGIDGIADFASEFGAEVDPAAVASEALDGKLPGGAEMLDWLRARAVEPLRDALDAGRALIAPVLLLALLRCALPDGAGGSEGARFLLRLTLLLGFSEVAAGALASAEDCIRSAKALTGAAAPALTALLAAMGMSGTSALVSPAAALIGDAAEGLFLNWGMRLCRFALCLAVAGNLSPAVDLTGAAKLLRKAANWGAGLATTLFTALLALQGSVAGAADGVAVRAAKFAVDSAAPVIGSGVSDAWDSYVSGVLIAKNAVGVSGIAALLGAVLRPMLSCAATMLLLNLLAALLAALGERDSARAAEQAGGICQMGLSLATGAVAIATVLLGAAMSAGSNLAG